MELDEFPSKWSLRRLSELCDIHIGKTPKRANRAYWENGRNAWATIADLNHGVLTETREGITDLALQECRCKPVEPGTLLLSFKLTIGKMAFAARRLFTNEAIAALPVKRGVELDARFLALALKVVPLLGEASDAAKGTTLNKDSLSELQIPVPPLAEQRRIVARVEAVTSRLHELLDHTRTLAEAVDRTLAAFYDRIIDGSASRPFDEIAKLRRRSVKTTPEGQYGEMGIRSFGKGTFPKPIVTGAQLGKKRVFRIRVGDLVFMNVFAWEGAVAVAQAADDGRVGSHRFLTHEVAPDLATAEFLCFHFLTSQGLEAISAASPGSAGRNRTLGIDKLSLIHVPVPAIEEQRRFARMSRLQHELRQLQGQVESELKAFTPALLAKAFRGEW